MGLWLLVVAALVGGPAAGRAAPAEWPGPYPGIAFEELQPLVRANAIFLLDVRNRSELLDPGRLPNSHNLPLHELDEALTLTATDFREKYGFVLPPPEQEMVLSCQSGFRAQAAAAKMIPAGYGNLRLYYGSFKDWARRGAPVSRVIPAEDVRRRLAGGKGLVLDIRPAAIRDKEGHVTGSRALPAEELAGALLLPPSGFEKKFGFRKPLYDDQLTVLGGGKDRALDSVAVFNERGYFDLRLYLGPMDNLGAETGTAAK
ncbi:uncharacterized protein LOC119093134 [Pollicipes pollicipes]|uniref:uncharacterized protein LOC119093134 n=1 Tax=Pollicipes pollicipes TaxID=41117 RepID=UPI001884F3E7|nr:uncharacterized protein LOC119093134 [Pollicipes pollicipes]